MSDVIYKYGPFTHGDVVEYAGTPVHVGIQDNAHSPYPDFRVYVWCRLSDGIDTGGKAKIVATGEEYTGRYIGTVIMPSGLVWHVVEI